MISSEITNKLAVILKNAGCEELFLFGSQATGDADENSDIDIGVKGLPPKSFFSVHAQLEEACGKQVDLVDFDEKQKLYILLNNLGELKALLQELK